MSNAIQGNHLKRFVVTFCSSVPDFAKLNYFSVDERRENCSKNYKFSLLHSASSYDGGVLNVSFFCFLVVCRRRHFHCGVTCGSTSVITQIRCTKEAETSCYGQVLHLRLSSKTCTWFFYQPCSPKITPRSFLPTPRHHHR